MPLPPLGGRRGRGTLAQPLAWQLSRVEPLRIFRSCSAPWPSVSLWFIIPAGGERDDRVDVFRGGGSRNERPPPGRPQRVRLGHAPHGPMHLGHYHGVLKNWLGLQTEYECFFFIADLARAHHALRGIGGFGGEHVLGHGHRPARGRRGPEQRHAVLQSRVPAHAELHLLLSMITPLPSAERVPSYKDQQAQMQDRDLSTYGFRLPPAPECRHPYIPCKGPGCAGGGGTRWPTSRITREVARRFNHLYGRNRVTRRWRRRPSRSSARKTPSFIGELRQAFLEQGDKQGLVTAGRCSNARRT